MATYRPRPLKDIHTRAFDLFPRLAERRRQPAGTLSGGEQRMLAVARTLTPHTAVLLLDELSAGLSPHLLADLYAAVRLLADQGVAVLVVEQYAQEVLAVADAAALLVHGRIRMNGTPDDVEHHLARAYLGTLGDPPTARPTPRTTSAAQDTQDTAPENTAQSPHRTPPEHSRPVPPPSHRTADAAHEDPTRRVRPGRPARTGSAIIAVLGLALLVFCAAAFRRGHGLQTQLDQAALALLGLGLAVTGAAAWAGAFLIRPTLPRQERRTHDRNPNQGRSQGGGPDTPT
jgi:ABC-type glutathione transport system ATPase component